MLLLLVLSILALFLVVGAVGVLLALRAREAARAFAAASAGAAGSAQVARAQLDEALLRLVRGGSPAGAVTESLLEDKYGAGTASGCTVTALSGTTGAVITATVTGLDLTNPATVAGRLLTFVPAAGDVTLPSSYRILRTGTVANTVLLANVKPNVPVPLPSRFPCEAVINGREFTNQARNEAYDAYDDQNPFLTQLVLTSSTVSAVQRPAFGSPGTACTVDNDSDGVPDGIWLSDVLPRQRTPEGGELSFEVSYLVLDLDGRLNINAHGSLVRAQVPRTSGQYPQDLNTVPPGMGYGPADVDASRLVATAAEMTSGAIPAGWLLMLQGGTVSRIATVSSATQWRPTPFAELVQAGRYGLGSAQPGGSTITGTNPLHSDYWVQYTASPVAASVPPNSPSDLKARLQVFTAGSPPTLTFARPASGPAWSTNDTDDVLGAGVAAHPYRMRIDEDAPRAAGTGAVDAVYTLGELERILRQFDADASLLAPRLAALLDARAERSRMTLTTDSWDTPAITGETAQQTRTAVTAGNPYAVLSPETVAGLRFNVNRPIGSGTTAAARDFFRQLYTLCVALGAPAGDAAQWAANVVEFRDPDSVMSWFPYDATPLDGVWTTGTGVWGIERPEVVITEASVNGNQASVTLYRPWAASCTGTNTLVAEVIDARLGVSGTTNTLNAAAVRGADPVWRLSVGGSASGLNTLLSSATAVATNTALPQATINASSPPTQVSLQRLADPSRARDTNTANATYNDYVTIHTVSVPTASRQVSRWLHWPNRDLVSHGELLAVPAGNPAAVPEACFDASRETSLARTNPRILDATIVPSRFVGAHLSVGAGTFLNNTGYENFQYGQFSRWREPGRVNVNTILPNSGHPADVPHLDDAVWITVAGRSGLTNPAQGTPPQPVRFDRDLLVSGADAVFARPPTDATAASGFLRRSTAIRLANVATIRSHVFAVWITLRITDSSANGGPPRYHRMFAIVDRSIPVGFQAGRTLNVRDAIRLQRYLE